MVVVNGSHLTSMDYSACEAFYHGAEALKHVDIALKICGLTVCYIVTTMAKHFLKYCSIAIFH